MVEQIKSIEHGNHRRTLRHKNVETGEIYEGKLPVGAMYDVPYYRAEEHGKDAEWEGPSALGRGHGDDRLSLMVVTPGGSWFIDGRASNCDMKDDNTHNCWIRHGTPPNITVDKKGHTCGAGAGSIGKKNYHGFLRNGYLTL